MKVDMLSIISGSWRHDNHWLQARVIVCVNGVRWGAEEQCQQVGARAARILVKDRARPAADDESLGVQVKRTSVVRSRLCLG